jgi:hypothetical protein
LSAPRTAEVHLVGTERQHTLGLAATRSAIPPFCAKPSISAPIRAAARWSTLKPFQPSTDQLPALGQRQRRAERAGDEAARADDHRRALGLGHRLGDVPGQLAEHRGIVAEELGRVGRLPVRADDEHLGPALAALRRRTLSSGASQRTWLPTIRIASASSIPAKVELKLTAARLSAG